MAAFKHHTSKGHTTLKRHVAHKGLNLAGWPWNRDKDALYKVSRVLVGSPVLAVEVAVTRGKTPPVDGHRGLWVWCMGLWCM